MELDARGLSDVPLVVLPELFWTDRGQCLADLYGQHGPIFRARHLKADVVFMIGPEANRFLLVDQRQGCSNARGWAHFFGDDGGPPNLLTMDPPDHPRHRRILAPAFAARRVEEHWPLIESVVGRRLVRWAARGEIEVYEEARTIAFDLVARAFLGLQPGPELELGRRVYLHGGGGHAGAFRVLMRRKIEARRARPIDDALGLLARAHDEAGEPLSDAQLLAHAEIILVAGYETTASLGAWALYLLATNPEYAARVREERAAVLSGVALTPAALRAMPTLDCSLTEAERLYPPVPTVPRGIVADLVFAGHALPAGTLVLYSPAATHMLPGVWAEPQRFDPDRFAPPREEHRRTPYALAGFGGGPRVCIGMSFARAELLAVLSEALARYRLKVPPGQIIARRYGVTSRPLHGIRVRAVPV